MERRRGRMTSSGDLKDGKGQSTLSQDLFRKPALRKTDILLKGLELLAEYYALENEKEPMELGLRRLEQEALQYAESLRSLQKKEDALRQFVREVRFADEIIERHGCDASLLIQMLLEVQKKRNWLPRPVLFWLSERLSIPMSRIRQIASFYTAFSQKPQGRHTCQVCVGTACHVRGSDQLLTRVGQVLQVQPGETDRDQKFTLKTVNCLGCCAMGPVITVGEDYYSNPSVEELKRITSRYE